MDWVSDRVTHIIRTGKLRTGCDNYWHRPVANGLNAEHNLKNHMMTFQTIHGERLNG